MTKLLRTIFSFFIFWSGLAFSDTCILNFEDVSDCKGWCVKNCPTWCQGGGTGAVSRDGIWRKNVCLLDFSSEGACVAWCAKKCQSWCETTRRKNNALVRSFSERASQGTDVKPLFKRSISESESVQKRKPPVPPKPWKMKPLQRSVSEGGKREKPPVPPKLWKKKVEEDDELPPPPPPMPTEDELGSMQEPLPPPPADLMAKNEPPKTHWHRAFRKVRSVFAFGKKDRADSAVDQGEASEIPPPPPMPSYGVRSGGEGQSTPPVQKKRRNLRRAFKSSVAEGSASVLPPPPMPMHQVSGGVSGGAKVDGARSALLEQIQQGKNLRKTPDKKREVQDPRAELMRAIRERGQGGLHSVPDKKEAFVQKSPLGVNAIEEAMKKRRAQMREDEDQESAQGGASADLSAPPASSEAKVSFQPGVIPPPPPMPTQSTYAKPREAKVNPEIREASRQQQERAPTVSQAEHLAAIQAGVKLKHVEPKNKTVAPSQAEKNPLGINVSAWQNKAKALGLDSSEDDDEEW